jgi:hypothetical protein
MRRLIDKRLDHEFLRRMTVRYANSVFAQALAVPIALFYPRSGVALTLGVAAFYLLPPSKPRYQPGQEPVEEERASA